MGQQNAFWLSPAGKDIDGNELNAFSAKPETRHIETVVKHPSQFGETEKSIKDDYEKYNEPVGFEGKAREDILTRVIKRGFVRIRQQKRYWSIQIWALNQKTQDVLWMWAKEISSEKGRDKFADVTIHQLINNKMTKTSLDKVASGATIHEKSGKKYIMEHYTEDELDKVIQWKYRLKDDEDDDVVFKYLK